MRIKAYNLIFLVLTIIVMSNDKVVGAESSEIKERQIKAAFLYNYLKFIEWPEEQTTDDNEPVTIGIIGDKDYVKFLEPLQQKKYKGRNISIKYFTGYEKLKKTDEKQWNMKITALKSCHVIFLCTCDDVHIENPRMILKALEGSPILTVGETEDFLKFGGTINFLKENKKVCFEINVVSAKKNKLKISSKLLRLAKRVIQDQST